MKKNNQRRYERCRQKRKEVRRLREKAKRKIRNVVRQNRGRDMILSLWRTLKHFFPDLFAELEEQITDPRTRKQYRLKEIILAALVMFLFKEGSRHAFNLDRQGAKFRRNYKKLFGAWPHMDTVEAVFRKLSPDELEEFKTQMIRSLIKKKVLAKFRLFGQFYCVAVDATYLGEVPEGHCPHCLKKESKNGKVSYFHMGLEAKLVTSNGFSLSLASEFLENPSSPYKKQDCELKAFGRLAKKLNKFFPKLPITILADGLYPNQTFFDICQRYNWQWVVTLKDGNLASIWRQLLEKNRNRQWKSREEEHTQGKQKIHHLFNWCNDLPYHGHTLHWFCCSEKCDSETQWFAYLSSQSLEWENIVEFTKAGRLRWKIENQGFNVQKNQGYALKHRFSRKSWQASKNYYLCLQIAHLLHQLMALSSSFKTLKEGGATLKFLFKQMLAFLAYDTLTSEELQRVATRKCQFRYS